MRQNEFYRYEGGEFLEEQARTKQFRWKWVVIAGGVALLAIVGSSFDFFRTPV
ncbi:MAG: hypothetical protein WDZ93_02930 [Candidatus Paceibacterota bacterium]